MLGLFLVTEFVNNFIQVCIIFMYWVILVELVLADVTSRQNLKKNQEMHESKTSQNTKLKIMDSRIIMEAD